MDHDRSPSMTVRRDRRRRGEPVSPRRAERLARPRGQREGDALRKRSLRVERPGASGLDGCASASAGRHCCAGPARCGGSAPPPAGRTPGEPHGDTPASSRRGRGRRADKGASQASTAGSGIPAGTPGPAADPSPPPAAEGWTERRAAGRLIPARLTAFCDAKGGLCSPKQRGPPFGLSAADVFYPPAPAGRSLSARARPVPLPPGSRNQ